MNVSQLLWDEALRPTQDRGDLSRQGHQYPKRHNTSAPHAYYTSQTNDRIESNGNHSDAKISPGKPKVVNFQLFLSVAPNHRARLPLRVHIQPHDTTESIVTTVKNFYGLYEGEGVSFEDDHGNTLIAQYENLSNDTTVHVRVTPEHVDNASAQHSFSNQSTSPRRPRLDEPFQMSPPHAQSQIPRPGSRVSKTRSISPSSMKANMTGHLSRNALEPLNGQFEHSASYSVAALEQDLANGFSDSDAGSVSVSSSRRAKSDQLASAEISLNNIVEGGRRKRAFESSELPLFIPPQVPMTTSISSTSPQRRVNNHNAGSPSSYNNQFSFAYNYALPSPQSFVHDGRSLSTSQTSKTFAAPAQAAGHRLRARTTGNSSTKHYNGVMPTPDPTIASVISDEDVALQLMRLGDASNLSLGRTSTSTLDDAFSGKAEAASSGENTDDDMSDVNDSMQSLPQANEVSAPVRKKQRGLTHSMPIYEQESSEDDYEDYSDHAHSDIGDTDHDHDHQGNFSRAHKGPKSRSSKSSDYSTAKGYAHSTSKKSKSVIASKATPPADGLGIDMRKASSTSATGLQKYGTGEDDLSSKPRCQRCRKSKKGCDRQRPCGRCKDAGIGIDGCVSEDEGNGRKGRYGRHMGVPVKKGSKDTGLAHEPALTGAPTTYYSESVSSTDKSKKRKR